jgi:DNA-binding transcriptional LysR family regulator
MEMHQIRYFLAVAEHLNFTRAAEHCHVAQPSLTRAIKLLEDEFGGPLFHRERANTHLSELGRMVLPHLRQIFDQAQTAKRQATDFTKLKSTPLKLGIMCTLAPSRLVGVLAALHARHAGIEIQLVDAASSQLEDLLVGGDLEVAIYAKPSSGRDERLHYMTLFRERMMIATGEGSRLAASDVVRGEELDGQRYLKRVNCEFTHAGPIFAAEGAAFAPVYRSERDDWILAMVAAGLGFAFMPEFCIDHPGVVARPLVDPEFWREVNLVTVRGRPHSPAVGALVREASRAKWPGDTKLAAAEA